MFVEIEQAKRALIEAERAELAALKTHRQRGSM